MDWKVFLFGKRLVSLTEKILPVKKTSSSAKETLAKEAPKADAKTASAKPTEAKPVQAKSAESKSAEKKEVKAESKPVVKEVKKKFFFMDVEYLAVVLLLVIVLFGAKTFALSIDAPQSVVVNDKAVFSVDLTNNSDLVENISLNFYTPATSTIDYPKQLAPNSTAKATITVNNTINKNVGVFATLEGTVGEVKVQKLITLNFKQSSNSNFSAAMAGLFSFGEFISEVSGFTFIDWVIFWILVVIAAILLIAFAARIAKRNGGN